MSSAANQAAKIRVNYPTGPVEYVLPNTPGDAYIIGRGVDASLRFDSTPIYGYISNRHCHIILQNNVYKLGDGVPNGKPSSAGTYVNGQRLSGGYHTLAAGDTIKLGTRSDAVTINYLGTTVLQESATMLEHFSNAPTQSAGPAMAPPPLQEENTEPIPRQEPINPNSNAAPGDDEPMTTDPSSTSLDYACGICGGKSFTWGTAIGPKSLEFRAEGEIKGVPIRARRCNDCGSVVFFAKMNS